VITPSISDSYAEYLRILLTRATDEKEVERLRDELTDVISKLYKQHKEKVREHGQRYNR
jgi:septum formation topological specificity factor MinE